MFCQRCGALIHEGELFCGECGAPVQEKQNQGNSGGYQDRNSGNRGGVQRGRDNGTNQAGGRDNFNTDNGVNNKEIKLLFGLNAAKGEVPVRQYYCSRLRIPRCNGYLTVTNKRLIFQGKTVTGSSRISQEIPIDSVGAIYCGYGTFVRWLLMLLSVLMLVASIWIAVDEDEIYLLGLIPAALFFFLSLRKTFTLKIMSAKAVGEGISVGMGGSGIIGSRANFAVIGFAADDTDKMLRELGAMVQDLQTMGDMAVEEWKK